MKQRYFLNPDLQVTFLAYKFFSISNVKLRMITTKNRAVHIRKHMKKELFRKDKTLSNIYLQFNWDANLIEVQIKYLYTIMIWKLWGLTFCLVI